ncbi:MAG: hypothetical protein NVS2B16_09200 [Chloroflexota bacterium]
MRNGLAGGYVTLTSARAPGQEATLSLSIMPERTCVGSTVTWTAMCRDVGSSALFDGKIVNAPGIFVANRLTLLEA